MWRWVCEAHSTLGLKAGKNGDPDLLKMPVQEGRSGQEVMDAVEAGHSSKVESRRLAASWPMTGTSLSQNRIVPAIRVWSRTHRLRLQGCLPFRDPETTVLCAEPDSSSSHCQMRIWNWAFILDSDSDSDSALDRGWMFFGESEYLVQPNVGRYRRRPDFVSCLA
jgi:hypothetical protein